MPEFGIENYNRVIVPAKSVVSIILEHGAPHYIKIDIEGMDIVVLRSLFDNEIYPPYLSAELQSFEVYYLLAQSKMYRSFKLVDGETVSEKYASTDISTKGGQIQWQFPYHSAGPYGNDIHGKWYSIDAMHVYLAHVGFGWKDLHVSSVDLPKVTDVSTSEYVFKVMPTRWFVSKTMLKCIMSLRRFLRYKLGLKGDR